MSKIPIPSYLDAIRRAKDIIEASKSALKEIKMARSILNYYLTELTNAINDIDYYILDAEFHLRRNKTDKLAGTLYNLIKRINSVLADLRAIEHSISKRREEIVRAFKILGLS